MMSNKVDRTAVVGDVGGYVAHLRHALGQLGVTETVWPDDLHVIQVGDLSAVAPTSRSLSSSSLTFVRAGGRRWQWRAVDL